jgi:HEAT repeat protein
MKDETRQLIAGLLADREPDVRRHAAETLASAGGLAAVTALAAALQDESKGVRDAAFRSLCSVGGINVARAIVEYIGDEDIVVRNLAAELLIKLGTVSIPAILPHLHDRSQDIRKFAVDILGLIGDPGPASEMEPLLSDPDENVVVSTVEALGNMKAGAAIQALCETYDRSPLSRGVVAEALGKIGDPASTEFLVHRLQEAVGAEVQDPVVLFTLIEALGIVGTERISPVLLQSMGRLKGRLRSALLHALVLIAGRSDRRLDFPPEFRADFLEALRDPEPEVRLSAARVLMTLPGFDISTALMRAFGSSAELDGLLLKCLPSRTDAFAAALQHLEQHRARSVKGIIVLLGRLTFDLTRSIMKSAVTEMQIRQLERTFILIADRWSTADEETRAAIVDLLFRIDGDNAVEFLDAIMNDPDPWLRVHVIEIIAAIADPRAPEFIARFLQDDDVMVRDVAIRILEARGYPHLAAGQEAEETLPGGRES